MIRSLRGRVNKWKKSSASEKWLGMNSWAFSTLVPASVAKKSWPTFREAEAEILKELLKNLSTKHVISLGGDIVDRGGRHVPLC